MKKTAWYQRKTFWRRLLIYAVVLVVGCIVVRWRWQVKQERQAEQMRIEERRLVKELVASYKGVKCVHFHGVYYNRMTGFTSYTFLVNDQKKYSAYSVGGVPGKHHRTPEIQYSESFFRTNGRSVPLSATEANIGHVKISYAIDLEKEW
ncbi:MAG: hypothetical protein LKJ69_06840 [Lactobacillus sp.]|nr:hypothetical protein [Lactobacillus sp.]